MLNINAGVAFGNLTNEIDTLQGRIQTHFT